MKALIVTPSLHGGGAEASMSELVSYLRSMGVMTKFVGINSYPLTVENLYPDDHCLERKNDSSLIDTLRFGFKLRRVVQRYTPDFVVVNCEISELLSVLLPPVKLFVVEHTSRPWMGRRALGLIVRVILYLKRSKWITVNKDQKKIWPTNQSCVHIPNPITVPLPTIGRNYDLVFVGRLNKLKHPELVLSLAEELSLKAILVGDGPLFDSLAKQVTSRTISLSGFKIDPWEDIGRDDLVVFPSDYEGDGRTVAEAIIRGNPVLLKDNEDLRRFGLNENSYFSTYDTLKVKVKRYLDNGPDAFRPSAHIRDPLAHEREIIQVGLQWLKILMD